MVKLDKETFQDIESYMLSFAGDSAHDGGHVCRVLYTALDIARSEQNVDMDVLIAACVLHDTGRPEQFANPSLNHADVGGEKAYRFLRERLLWPEEKAAYVRACITSHSYRAGNPPRTAEAKILFDADKIDTAGAIGIARTLFYKAQVSEPLYTLREDGTVSDGAGDAPPSFFQEYRYKLEPLYERFYTARGREIARKRQSAAMAFYDSLLHEIRDVYEFRGLLEQALT